MGRRREIKKVLDGWNGKTAKTERLGGWKWKIKVFVAYWLGNWEIKTLTKEMERWYWW